MVSPPNVDGTGNITKSAPRALTQSRRRAAFSTAMPTT